MPNVVYCAYTRKYLAATGDFETRLYRRHIVQEILWYRENPLPAHLTIANKVAMRNLDSDFFAFAIRHLLGYSL